MTTNPTDDWLRSSDYYPLYHNLFKLLARGAAEVRLLEIGVRTGYIAAVFARAVEGKRRYVGVDPGLYVRDGLQRAERTLTALKDSGGDIEIRIDRRLLNRRGGAAHASRHGQVRHGAHRRDRKSVV